MTDTNATTSSAGSGASNADEQQQHHQENLRLADITEGENERKIPIVKFIEDVDAFAASFQPPAPAELLIGAYTELHSKYKMYETSLSQKKEHLVGKVPELEKSLTLVQHLLQKKQEECTSGVVRYSLADNIYGKVEIDYTDGQVNLWLGANVMLQFTYEEAIAFLTNNKDKATTELATVKEDLAFVREQIVTSEVTMARLYNYDVRRKRRGGTTTPSSTTATAAAAASGK